MPRTDHQKVLEIKDTMDFFQEGSKKIWRTVALNHKTAEYLRLLVLELNSATSGVRKQTISKSDFFQAALENYLPITDVPTMVRFSEREKLYLVKKLRNSE